MHDRAKLVIPELSLVVLIGASGAGKSTFAREHFRPTEVLSSDFCRGLVSDDENQQSATSDAFEVLHFIAARRLARGRLVVVDATNVQAEARKPLLALAREYHCLPVAIVFNLPERLLHERNRQRPDRDFGPHVVRRQRQELRRSLSSLEREGFRYLYVLSSPEEVEAAVVERQPLWTNRTWEHGPFDIVGDVHGCFDELVALLERLGYEMRWEPEGDGVPAGGRYQVLPPEGRKAVFLGDLVDRGPNTPGVLRLAMDMVAAGVGLCVPGNHERKLLRKLKGRNVQVTHGLAETLAQLEQEPTEFQARVAKFLDGLVSHYVLDDGKLVVAHAGLKEGLQGRASRAVREFALYGETTGETDEFGLPVRYPWARDYRGQAMVVYGHTPVPEPAWLNRTTNLDTGCVFGGKLSALRYPELELVSVPAARTYYQPARPFLPEGEQAPPAEPRQDGLLDIQDVLGGRAVQTRLLGPVTIREERAAAALEVMSRFALDPRWLIYLPPTMSPTETSQAPGLLEHPAEAFAYYRHEGVPQVVCEEKHMGSRAVLIVCRDEAVARRRFDVGEATLGACYTRTGRRFFDAPALEAEVLGRVRAALEASGLWEELRTDWVCLDCELLPWSAKAQELLRHQYAAAGAASRAALPEAVASLAQAVARGQEVGALLERFQGRAAMAERYVEAYGRYCWPVHSVADLRLAPFHLLASEGAAHVGKDHWWHMETLARLCRADEALLLATPCRVVDVTDTASQDEAVRWWEALTERGGEGMVAKPLPFVAQGRRRLAQPAVKCRGREYLRIIYGPEYTAPEHLEQLRQRSLATKRALALREFALGVEALERFVRQEPLYRVHECVFAVLALESEPVDPRL
ncbi:MAG: polynucleotide kinase-phosphatase [Chloroflexi bacterium]|nr:polynucleotide kinase-phosphatase [Chloroflexota bacterium]